MEKQLENLESRIQKLEDSAFIESKEIEDLEFDIITTEPLIVGDLRIRASGSIRKWRETRDFRGAIKYSNWSVTVTVIDKNNNDKPTICDWIKLSNCNYRIKQNPIIVEKPSIGFTTDNGQGWDNIRFDVQIKHSGLIYNPVTFDIG